MIKSIFQFPSWVREADDARVPPAAPVEDDSRSAPEGLIPASQLPSAADTLAELFDGDPRDADQADEALAQNRLDTFAQTAQTTLTLEEKAAEPDVSSVPEPQLAASPEPVAVSPEPEPSAEPQPETPLLAEPEIPSEVEQTISTEPLLPGADSLPETDLPPEITLSINLAEQAVDEATRQELPPPSPLPPAPAQAAAPVPSPQLPASDWALAEKLAVHKEWVESRGSAGKKADFAEAELQHMDLINVELRYADLQGANLKGSDLLLADLRDACLVRTNLQDCCLVGANLEGANLEGANLDGAMGLLPRQLAGANLHDASIPDPIARFEARSLFAQASQLIMQLFTAMMAISAISALAIWKTRDIQLLTDSSIFPFLHSRAAAALPTAQVYLIAPIALFIIYLVLQFHLQTLWDAVLQLPAVFPDGAEIGQDSPRMIRALLRAHFRWMNHDAPSTRVIERMLARVLAYWLAPAILLLFWARYLTLQDLHGTLLHALLVAVSLGVALYSSTKIGRPQERWSVDARRNWLWLSRLRDFNPLKAAAYLFVALLFLSVGTVKGVPHGKNRAPQFSTASVRRWAPDVFWALGYDPYANVTEAAISTAPPNWSGADSQLSEVKGARLNDTSFRYAQAYGIFLAHAHLWHTNWEGSFLSDADFRDADLGQASLRFAVMDRARLYHANLDRADLFGANLNRGDFRGANLSYASLENSILIDAQFQDASLYGARLTGASMERANFERADLRSAFLETAKLEHADLQNAYLWSTKMAGSDLQDARLGSTIFVDADMRNVDLRGAQFSGTVMTGANLTGALIDGTDLRGALSLTAAQVCSTKSRAGAILNDSLAQQVRDTCGGPLLAAPEPAPAPASPTPATASAPNSKPHTPAASHKASE